MLLVGGFGERKFLNASLKLVREKIVAFFLRRIFDRDKQRSQTAESPLSSSAGAATHSRQFSVYKSSLL